MPVEQIRVRGLPELAAAFAKVDSQVKREMRPELLAAGEPVRAKAEEDAVSGISNIGAVWSRMKLGAGARVVYVAPRTRKGKGSSRPNLAGELMEAMEQALDSEQERVAAMLDLWLGRVTAEF